MFEYIKDYYEKVLYTKDDLETLLNGELLTQDEYDSLINPTPTLQASLFWTRKEDIIQPHFT